MKDFWLCSTVKLPKLVKCEEKLMEDMKKFL